MNHCTELIHITSNFEINGYYLDDMLTYSPARLGVFLNSSSDNFSDQKYFLKLNDLIKYTQPYFEYFRIIYRCKLYILT